MTTTATTKCDHIDTLERIIDQRYGIEAFYPDISQMFSEPEATVRIYASPGLHRLFVATHDASLQFGSIGHTRIDDVLGHRDVAERMTRDEDVHYECIDLFYRQHHAA